MHHNRGPLPTPANGYQFTLVGNAVDGGSVETQFKWGIAIHNSHYGLIQDNVVYNYNGVVDRHRGRIRELQRVRPQLRAARHGRAQQRGLRGPARSAMGTEGVGFWFRGPNNYVRNNVAANFQNATVEAAYGFVYQFRLLGNVAIPNFKGADTSASRASSRPATATTCRSSSSRTTKRTARCRAGSPIGGSARRIPSPSRTRRKASSRISSSGTSTTRPSIIYPAQKVTFDGLKIRGKHTREQPLLRQRRAFQRLFADEHRHPQLRHPGHEARVSMRRRRDSGPHPI